MIIITMKIMIMIMMISRLTSRSVSRHRALRTGPMGRGSADASGPPAKLIYV